jgi:hypothetical protein
MSGKKIIKNIEKNILKNIVKKMLMILEKQNVTTKGIVKRETPSIN